MAEFELWKVLHYSLCNSWEGAVPVACAYIRHIYIIIITIIIILYNMYLYIVIRFTFRLLGVKSPCLFIPYKHGLIYPIHIN
jgi:hypothetical protein